MLIKGVNPCELVTMPTNYEILRRLSSQDKIDGLQLNCVYLFIANQLGSNPDAVNSELRVKTLQLQGIILGMSLSCTESERFYGADGHKNIDIIFDDPELRRKLHIILDYNIEQCHKQRTN